MKTTIDLPDDLVHQLKLRAVHDRRKLKDITAEFLRRGLAARPARRNLAQPKVVKDRKTGLPVVQCRRTPAKHPTPDDIAQILIDQEVEWAENGEHEAS